MFPNYIDCLGRQKRETKQQQTNKEKPRKRTNEPLSEEWIGNRS